MPPERQSTLLHIGEVVATTTVGALLAAAVGSLVGLSVPAALVGAANGALAGTHRIHRWRSAGGWLAFGLDSTWALVTTAGALVVHAMAAPQRVPGNYVAELSERCDRHVYAKGYAIRRGFLLTVGNVVSGAGPAAGSMPRRCRIVTHHEHVHVWQARWFGPIYPVVYAGWLVVGGLIGAVVWLIRRPPDRFAQVVETYAYYRNPFEWWAYSREDRWPPPGAVRRHTWRRPIVRAFGDPVQDC